MASRLAAGDHGLKVEPTALGPVCALQSLHPGPLAKRHVGPAQRLGFLGEIVQRYLQTSAGGARRSARVACRIASGARAHHTTAPARVHARSRGCCRSGVCMLVVRACVELHAVSWNACTRAGSETLMAWCSVVFCCGVCVCVCVCVAAAGLDSRPGRCKACLGKAKKPKTAQPEPKKGQEQGAARGVNIISKPGGGDVGGSSSYKISNRDATRDMDWLCAMSSMEGAPPCARVCLIASWSCLSAGPAA